MASTLGSSRTLGIGQLSLVTAWAAAFVAAVVVALAADAIIAAVAHGAGVSHGFAPLNFSSFVGLTAVGLLVAASAWSLVRARSSRAGRTMKRLVPVVVAVSLVPDVALGVSKFLADTTWGGVAALILMHVAVAAVGVAAFALFMPLPRSNR